MDISDVIVGVRFPKLFQCVFFSAQTPVCLPVRKERLLCRCSSLYNVNRLGRGERLWQNTRIPLSGRGRFLKEPSVAVVE